MLRAVVLACVVLGLSTPSWAQQTECDHAWTFGGQGETLRDGANVGGIGSQYRCNQGAVYVLGTDKQWWRFNGVNWSVVGPIVPAVTTTPGPNAVAWTQDATNVSQLKLYVNATLQDVPLSAMTKGEVAAPVDFTSVGDYVIVAAVVGCTLIDAATKACLRTAEVKAMPMTVRVVVPTAPMVVPRNLVVRP